MRACVCNGVIQPCCRCIICCIGFCCIGVVKAAIQRIQLTLMVPARLHRIQLIQYTARIQYTAYTVYSTIHPPSGAGEQGVQAARPFMHAGWQKSQRRDRQRVRARGSERGRRKGGQQRDRTGRSVVDAHTCGGRSWRRKALRSDVEARTAERGRPRRSL